MSARGTFLEWRSPGTLRSKDVVKVPAIAMVMKRIMTEIYF